MSRDGLAPSTKSQKIYEVERYETRTRRIRRFLSLVMPRSVHVLRGNTARGVPLLLSWCAALVVVGPYLLSLTPLIGSNLTSDILTGSLVVPSTFEANPFVLAALVALPAIWLAANLWSSRSKEA